MTITDFKIANHSAAYSKQESLEALLNRTGVNFFFFSFYQLYTRVDKNRIKINKIRGGGVKCNFFVEKSKNGVLFKTYYCPKLIHHEIWVRF